MSTPEYIAARGVLLDALDALGAHLDAVILVGAQAVYLHAGTAELATAPTTTDADIALSPDRLRPEPQLEDALRAAGFTPSSNPGTWLGSGQIAIDLMVPEAVCGQGGRRGARLPVHGNKVARRTLGIEPALVDNEFHDLFALDPSDSRRVRLRVAGPAALLVSKIIKIHERLEQPNRLKPKDGLDVLRLLRTADTGQLAERLRALAVHEIAGEVTRIAMDALRSHGLNRVGAIGSLAARAVAGLEDPATVAESTVILIEDLVQTYDAADISESGCGSRTPSPPN